MIVMKLTERHFNLRDVKGSLCQNNNKKWCFLNTESLLRFEVYYKRFEDYKRFRSLKRFKNAKKMDGAGFEPRTFG